MRLVFLAGVILICTACADQTAIQAFAKMAPDPSTIQALTKDYSQELDVREDIKLLGDDPPRSDLAAQDKIRLQQALAIQGMDTSLREYMQALGAVAAGTVVQSSTNVKDVTAGLTTLQKDIPALGITAAQVTDITGFVQTVADLAESGYRNAKLVEIIGHADEPLDQLITLQAAIVTNGIRPSIVEIQTSLDEHANLSAPNPRTDVLKFIDEDLQHWAAAAAGAHSTTPNYASRNPAYGEPGAADAHAARYLLKKSLETDEAALTAQLAVADAYVKALNAIGAAHATLTKSGKKVLTKEMAGQIQPYAQEVYKDYQNIRSFDAHSATP